MRKIPLKRMWTALVVVLSLGFASEASAQYLQIGGDDFTKTFRLSQNPRIDFNAGGITVTDDGQSVDFAYGQIGKIRFMKGEPPVDGILPATTDVKVSRNGDLFVFNDSVTAAVYTTTGIRVLEAQVSAAEPLSVAQLGRGIYLMTVRDNNNKSITLKFIKL